MSAVISQSRAVMLLTLLLTSLFFSISLGNSVNLTNSNLAFLHSLKKLSIEDYSNVLRKRLDYLKKGDNKQVEIVFLIDGSSSVGELNFQNEVKFVRKLVADFVISPQHARIAVVVFAADIVTYINQINTDSVFEKCSLLQHDLPGIRYIGGSTFTLGAMEEAAAIFEKARTDAKKVVFLITDGFSNNGDPVPVAAELRRSGVKIFSFGIKRGNIDELFRMASPPSEEHAFFLESFSDFESLARRALHEDLGVGRYTSVADSALCSGLCGDNGSSCCNSNSSCACGSLSGHFSCLCPPGYYGSGLWNEPCEPCPKGTYSDGKVPGDLTTCRQCPDKNQNTRRDPATSIDDCVCEDGFIPVDDSCQVITCPAPKPPYNGYFVKENCSNVLNAACGVRCAIGYELTGASVRICQRNGSWTGEEPSCRPKRCAPLKPFEFGQVHCSNEDQGYELLLEYGAESKKTREVIKKKGPGEKVLSVEEAFAVDTECRFDCPVGYSMIGSKVRTCLPITRWNGLQALCKRITCLSFPKINYATVTPTNCTTRGLRHAYGATCDIECSAGFVLKGNSTRHCTGRHGTWTGKGQVYRCEDIQPPTIECPANQTTSTDPGSSAASFLMSPPNGTDNSGLPPSVWSIPPVMDSPPTLLPIGVHQIEVHARDSTGNEAVCSFWVEVKDMEKPNVDNCTSPGALTFAQMIDLDWTEPTFWDNSGSVIVTKENQHDTQTGVMIMNFTAVDASGNFYTCLVNATILDLVCAPPLRNSETEVNCSSSDGSTRCIFMCKVGFSSPYDNVTLTCIAGQWMDESNVVILNFNPNCSEIVQPKSSVLKGELDVSADICDDPQDLEDLENQLSEVLGQVDFKMECEKSEMEENTNLISRRKRLSGSQRRKILYTITEPARKNYYYQSTEEILANRSLLLKGKTVSIKSPERFVSCFDGAVAVRSLCVKCLPGHFYHGPRATCQPCPVGTFQDASGSLSCNECPNGTTTVKIGQFSVRDCKRICEPGTFSTRSNPSGLAMQPCHPCPPGQHQPLGGQRSCLSCWKSSGVVPKSCHNYTPECREDTCRNGGYCSVRFVGACVCQTGFFGKFCEKYFNPCYSQPCYHGGTCLETPSSPNFTCSCPNAFAGRNCELEVDLCASHQCENGGSCVSSQGEVYCSCLPGFKGTYCSERISACSTLSPCQNNGTCQDLPGGDFFCSCPSNFSGKYCDRFLGCFPEEKELCTLVPQKCPPGHVLQGKTCQSTLQTTSLNDDLVMHFPKSSSSNYLTAGLGVNVLTDVSVCFWVQTADQFNFGTVFSYANDVSDNAFTLTDCNGFVLYVNGDRVITDVVANDDQWHMVCVVWSSLYGTWGVYRDGRLSAYGENLSSGAPIQGGGSLVIGQEQDYVGGGFNEVESFVGKLSRMKFWNKSLTDDEVAKLSESCDSVNPSDMKNSMDLTKKMLLRGKIQMENSTFCRDCGQPPEIYRADVVKSGNHADYQCHPGFLIKFPDDLNPTSYSNWTRKCQITGTWDSNPPICARLSCGSPGFLSHGSIIGRSYLYEDSIKYHCWDNYQLVGPRRRTCLANGTWSDTKPFCQETKQPVKCPPLSAPRRGSLFLFTLSVWLEADSVTGDRAEFTCDAGFRLEGAAVLTCLESGQWDSGVPKCVQCEDQC